MVAQAIPLERRFPEPLAPATERGTRFVAFTREDVLTMIRSGIIPEDATTELLNGYIVLKDRAELGGDPMGIGRGHRKTVERFSDLRAKVNSTHRHVESQQPLACSDTHMPEPDFMILRGPLDAYEDIATAADALCIVEVADSSYERDVGLKLAAYARAGVPQYVVLNLRNRNAEVYASPDREAGTYAAKTIVSADGVLSLRAGDAGETFDVAMADVLP